MLVAVARGTHPGLHWLGYRAPRARASHPSGSRLSERSARIRSRPLAHQSPRKPSVPDRVQCTDRRPRTERRSNRFLAGGRADRATPFLAHDRGVPACNADAAFGAAVPPRFPEGKSQGHPLEQRGTVYVMEERRRRPNQEPWFEAKPPSGLAAPVLNQSSPHPKALVISNATSSLIMW